MGQWVIGFTSHLCHPRLVYCWFSPCSEGFLIGFFSFPISTKSTQAPGLETERLLPMLINVKYNDHLLSFYCFLDGEYNGLHRFPSFSLLFINEKTKNINSALNFVAATFLPGVIILKSHANIQ